MIPLPNTHLTQILPHILICAGEDQVEFEGAATRHLGRLEPPHTYRCYRFWRTGNTLLAWTGIGTGCIEPLVTEVFLAGVPQKIALIGTAGLTPTSTLMLGECQPVVRAFARNCALNSVGVPPDRALFPRARQGKPDGCSIASTDFYYPVVDHNWPLDVDLVDMEVAQFYFLNDLFARRLGLPTEYLAFKGAANSLGRPEEQASRSAGVVAASLRLASRWLHT